MSTATKFPTTLTERIELGAGEVRLPASWEEYTELLEDCEFQVEYEDKHVIFKDFATHTHEVIIANILAKACQILKDHPDLIALGSNRHVYLEEFEADYSPDASVLKGNPVEYELRKGLTAYTNPHIIFEVLSPSTARNDWNTKLPRYKKNPSLRQIVYVQQTHPFVSVFDRIGNSDRWENADYDRLEQFFLVEGQPVKLEDLYRKVVFTGEETSDE